MEFKSIPRCLVTGLDNNSGKSTIISDSLATEVKEHLPGLIISDIWKTTTSPATYAIPTALKNEAVPVTPTGLSLLCVGEYRLIFV